MTIPTKNDPAVQAIVDRILAVLNGWSRGTPMEQARADWEALYAPDPKLPVPEPVDAGGVPGVCVSAGGRERKGVVLYFHGGGYQLGSTRTYRGLMTALATAAGCRVLGIYYRLAPEHKFPAPIDDALAAYTWLLDQGITPNNVVLAGDSAGGGLALATMLALRDRKQPMPAAAVLLSPWTDLEATGDSYDNRAAVDPIHSRPVVRAMARAYVGRDGDPRDPMASPVHADLTGLPPLLIQAGDHETVRDDAIRIAERAEGAGVDVTLEVWAGMPHVFQLYAEELPDAAKAIAAIGAFVTGRLMHSHS
jgi:monoterpene epsilon-lactone hydrolase